MKHWSQAFYTSLFLSLLSPTSRCAETVMPAPPAAVDNAPVTTDGGGSPSPTLNNKSSYASDENRFDGDHLKLRVNATGFRPFNQVSTAASFCAPRGSVLAVKSDDGETLSVRFIEIPAKKSRMPEGATAESLSKCPVAQRVNDSTQYQINKDDLLKYDSRRSGVTFGALVVPFKFYLGEEKKLSASSTIAPYIGFRGPGPYGLTFTPVLSAGLGLVPVTNSATNESETKSALSTSVGIVLTSSKNQSFNAGIIFGRDFLSKADEASDPALSKIWFSLYVGYKL